MDIVTERILKVAAWPIAVVILALAFKDVITDYASQTAQIKVPGGVELNKTTAIPQSSPTVAAAPVVNVVQNNNGATESVAATLQRLSDIKDDLERTKQSSDFWKARAFEWMFHYYSNSFPVVLNVLSWFGENQSIVIPGSTYYTSWLPIMPDQNYQYSVLVSLQQAGLIETVGHNIRITATGVEFLKKFRLKPYDRG